MVISAVLLVDRFSPQAVFLQPIHLGNRPQCIILSHWSLLITICWFCCHSNNIVWVGFLFSAFFFILVSLICNKDTGDCLLTSCMSFTTRNVSLWSADTKIDLLDGRFSLCVICLRKEQQWFKKEQRIPTKQNLSLTTPLHPHNDTIAFWSDKEPRSVT